MLQRILVGLAWTAGALGGAAPAEADPPLMAAIFADHAVLQRDRPIDIWGTAAPGEEVTVTLSGATRKARADAVGRWSLEMPELPAGGPHTLTARTAARLQNADDVLVGDVWLCSGQSNMEWTVRNTLDARNEAAHSSNDRIRHVTIPKAVSMEPRADFAAPLDWKIADPATTPDFSAACYYFARELQKTVNVPHGIVLAAWGGTRIEPWLSESALRALGGNDDHLDVLREFRTSPAVAYAHWGRIFEQWWRGQRELTRGKLPWSVVRGESGEWRAAPTELIEWEHWGVPALREYDGIVWYRARVRLSAAQAKQAARLDLGAIDDVDVTWINGRAIASHFEGERSYAIPDGVLVPGENLVVVSVYDMWGGGGLHGPADKRRLQFADGSAVPLGAFEYQMAPAGLPPHPRAPWEPIAGLGVLNNAMIAPLQAFGLRGVAWYQGESNASVDAAALYQAQLQALMADWRRQFDAPLPFLVVQLANYGPVAPGPVESGWAALRDAQRRAVAADGNAGLAITHDIGNRDDIHPANKQAVGARLARAARHVVYGEKLSASGAVPKSARRAGSTVIVTFGDFEGALAAYGSRDPAAFELCGLGAGSCSFVRAQLPGDGRVMLDLGELARMSEMWSPKRVRYCWADSPLCNLYDGAGLPVGPFEVPID